MTAFAVLTFLLNIVAIAAFGPGADILGHTGPGRIVVYVIALVLAFFFTRASAPPMALGLGRIPLWKNTIARGWLFGIAGYLAYALIMFLGGAVEFKAPRSPADIAAAIPLCAISGFGIAVAEEIVFRGFLLRAAALQLPRWPAIALTGIAFGFFHELASPGDLLAEPADRMLFGGVFCLHLLLAAAAIRTRSLHLGIGIHSGLVFGEALFRKLRLFDVANDDSWFLGLDGDPRRGFLSWALFIAATILIPRIMGRRAMEHSADRPPIHFAQSAPACIIRSIDVVGSIGKRREWAWWALIASLAVVIRLIVVAEIPFALAHDGTVPILKTDLSAPDQRPMRGWLLPILVGIVGDGDTALAPIIWLQHGAVLLGLCSLFVALRTLLGKWSFLPLAACALGCAVHGLPVYLAQHLLPGAFQFALNALAISLWAMRVGGGGAWLAFASALFAGVQGFNAFTTWPLIAIMVIHEIAMRRRPDSRSAGLALALAGAALPILGGWFVFHISPVSYLKQPHQGRALLSLVAHLDASLTADPNAPSARAAQSAPPAQVPDANRAGHFARIYRRVSEEEPDAGRRDQRCLRLAVAIMTQRPAAALGAWRHRLYALICRGSENISYPGESELNRTARYTARSDRDPTMAMHRMATERLPKFENRKPRRAPELSVWFMLILPPILATTLLLAMAALVGPPARRWFAIGCLSIWIPALFRLSLVSNISARDVAGLVAITMFIVPASVALMLRAAVASLRGSSSHLRQSE